MKWETTEFIKSRDKNNGFRLLLILWSGQLLVLASNLSVMGDMTGEWKFIILTGFFFCITGGFLLYRTLKKNEKRGMLKRLERETEYFETVNQLKLQNEGLRLEQMEELKKEMKLILDKAETVWKTGNLEACPLDFSNPSFQEGWEEYGHAVISAVLKDKFLECRKYGIEMKMSGMVGEVPGIASIHLCSVFSNLLDNAISASKKEVEGKRQIWLNTGVKGEYLAVLVSNRCSLSCFSQPPAPGHGYGKQILEEISQLYDGYYESGIHEECYKAAVFLRLGRIL